MKRSITAIVRVTGIVQGVGFRPFVYKLGVKNNLTGFVLNDNQGVYIEVSGNKTSIKKFLKQIKISSPIQSQIDYIKYEFVEYKSHNSFEIKTSKGDSFVRTLISPDLSICKECEYELLDKKNHRYQYPFINCTNCGPRYSIISNTPYDRKNTVMNEFAMCEYCNAEYKSVSNRRFHAEPVSCFDCGPKVQFLANTGQVILSGDDEKITKQIFDKVKEELDNGKIIAIKGVGGFHLVCDATNDEAVSTMRMRKNREEKPFAIMVKSINKISKFAHINAQEKKLLQSTQKPIVLLRKKVHIKISDLVAPRNNYIGIMLSYTPVHILLFRDIVYPLVMTSGNISGNPIEYTNEGALENLNKIADFFLIGDRKIYIRCDDSVVMVAGGHSSIIRRARGYVPRSIKLPIHTPLKVLALGAEQKNTICILKGNDAVLSQHIGDIKTVQSYKALKQSIIHLTKIFEFTPQIIAADLHPNYLSTQLAINHSKELDTVKDCKVVRIQHHHAHAVSCMVENNLNEEVLAIVLDGTGYATDGTIWGGEILSVNYREFTRLASFKPIIIPGGEVAIREVWRMGLSYLYDAFGKGYEAFLPDHYSEIYREKIAVVIHQLSQSINSPITTSCGRLFDGVSAITGTKMVASYEGQAAIEFEQVADKLVCGAYKFSYNKNNSPIYIDYKKVIQNIAADTKNNIPISVIATKFHRGLVNILSDVTVLLAKKYHLNKIVLSGGCFMNRLILTSLMKKLKYRGLTPYSHEKVPCNDGGLSLGQAVIAHSIIEH